MTVLFQKRRAYKGNGYPRVLLCVAGGNIPHTIRYIRGHEKKKKKIPTGTAKSPHTKLLGFNNTF